MCIFLSSSDTVDMPWLNEIMLTAPEGPSEQPESQLFLSGLVRPGDASAKITFIHRGEICDLRDHRDQWVMASESEEKDWMSSKILNHEKLQFHKYDKIKSIGEPGKLDIRYKKDAPPITACIPEIGISEVKVYCVENDYLLTDKKEPTDSELNNDRAVFSSFSITFPVEGFQLFRISFRTRFGIEDYSSQIGFDVEGPDLVYRHIQDDISRLISNERRRLDLRNQMGVLYDNGLEPYCEVAVVGHPSMALTIEESNNAPKSNFFAIESDDTPIRSAACPTKVAFFKNSQAKNFSFTGSSSISNEPRRAYSAEFMSDLDALTDLLKKKDA